MSSPLETPEFGTLYVGNTKDDDGPVIDSLVQEVDTPATPVVQAISPAPLIRTKRNTRLLSGTLIFDNTVVATYAPIQILPADLQRLEWSIQAFSYAAAPTSGDYVYLADENGKLPSSSAGRLRNGSILNLDDHNGALWVLPSPGLTGLFEVSYWATTGIF
jgi:hypothetical protein